MKVELDEFDLAAEREGQAIKASLRRPTPHRTHGVSRQDVASAHKEDFMEQLRDVSA